MLDPDCSDDLPVDFKNEESARGWGVKLGQILQVPILGVVAKAEPAASGGGAGRNT